MGSEVYSCAKESESLHSFIISIKNFIVITRGVSVIFPHRLDVFARQEIYDARWMFAFGFVIDFTIRIIWINAVKGLQSIF
ncbi:hypothetical protein PUN28_020113 [Cardiocondyla obscurior]|uniref:Uncharacterized protein n=1 Tax=Cardiocondyla obscurior TaxID=286306 RepID=A0AAW2EBY1_9HYME